MAKSGNAFHTGRGKAFAAAGERAAKADRATELVKSNAASKPAASPELVWDKRAMTALLNAVRAESFGELTLNPAQDAGFLGRLVSRVRSASFSPTDSQICLKLFEWHAAFGGSPEAFEKCEMSVQRTDAAKRHEGIWASQAASVSRSAVGIDDSQVKRVPRLSYQAASETPASPARASAFRTSAAPSRSPDNPPAAHALPVAAAAKGKKRALAAANVTTTDSGHGKSKGKADAGENVNDESVEEETTNSRRTRRKLLPANAADHADKSSSPQSPENAKGAEISSTHATPSQQTSASRAPTAEKGGKELYHPLSLHSRTALSAAADAQRGSSSRSASAASARQGASGGGGKPVASRRLALAAVSSSSAAPQDPEAGVLAFLQRARNALREAGGAEKYASANVSGANARVPMSQILLGTTAASSSSNGIGNSSSGSGSSAAGVAHVAPSSPSKRRKARKEAALQPADKEEEDTGKDTGGDTRKDEAALQPTETGGDVCESEAVMEWGMAVVRRQLCCNHVSNKQEGLDVQLEEVTQVLESCLTAGSNGSALLLGPHGSGKSAVLQRALDTLADKYAFPGFLVVRLNGLVHTTDVLAVREIARQLYLLDHVNAEHEFGHELKQLSNSEHALNFLFELVKRCQEVSQPVFFILDHFHLFATHQRQSLLYNLLDLTQSARAQTVVLGLSHALDCVESLEKRVRSRFSGRTILFMNAPCAERSCKILSTALSIPDEALVPLQRPAAAESVGGKKKRACPTAAKLYAQAWNARVSCLLADAATHVALEPLLVLSGDAGSLLAWAVDAVIEVDADDCLLRPQHLLRATDALRVDTRQRAIAGLSQVELAMLATVRRLLALGSERVTVQDICTHYADFLKSHPQAAPSSGFADLDIKFGYGNGGALQVLSTHAVERLIRIQLLVWVDKKMSCGQSKDHRALRLALCPQQLLEIFEKDVELPSVMTSWATQRLVKCHNS